jgi:hypothetical protein
MSFYKNLILILTVGVCILGPVRVGAGEGKFIIDQKNKISFNLSELNDQGLYGPAGGLRALNYEFCIPADPLAAAQVKAIDPNVEIHHGSQGRIKCSREEYLCIGSSRQPEFRKVLLNLARLPFVKQINQCFFE